MPFSGPEGQGPFSGFQDCVSSMSDEEDVDDPEGLCAVWMRQAEKLSDEYDVQELLDVKQDLGLSEMEFLSALKLLEEEGTLTEKLEPGEISVGDWVSWQWQGNTVRGKVTGGAREERTVAGNTIVGEEGVEDVFELEEWDDQAEEMGSRVAKSASSLSEAERPSSFDSKADFTEEERTPPKTAQDNAQQALDARDDTGNPNDCGTDTGWARANQLANGEPLSEDVIERMAQFNRHRDSSEMSDDEGRSDCGWMMWQAWGGDEGVDWAIRMSEKMDEASQKSYSSASDDLLDWTTDGSQNY